MEQRFSDIIEKATEAQLCTLAVYGEVMCVAQTLERELVFILTALRLRTGALKNKDFDRAFEEMIRMPSSEVLSCIRGGGGNLSKESEQAITKALHSRNFLAHRFFYCHPPIYSAAESKRIIIKLQKTKSDLKAAFDLLQPIKERLNRQSKVFPDRQEAWEVNREQVISAIASFYEQ